MSFSNVVSYFRDCYEADNRRTTIWNIFHQSVEHRLFVEPQEQLLNGVVPFIWIDPLLATAVQKAAYVYRKEKQLVYCSLFLVGWRKANDQQPQPICAPLLVHSAQILKEDPHLVLKPDLGHRQLNHYLLDSLEGTTNNTRISEQVAEKLSEEALTIVQIADIASLLEEVAGLDATRLYHYPKLVSGSELQAIFNSIKDNPRAKLSVVPASVAALVKKSVETRGVLNELSDIAASTTVSASLKTLFDPEHSPGSSSRQVSMGRVPAVLSNPQKNILESAATNHITLVIGPPGTGKSFTLAALAIEHLSRGQSVLIASKMNHAVDLIGNKIEEFGLKKCIVRGGRKRYLKDLRQYLEQLLSGMHGTDSVTHKELAQLKKELTLLDRSIGRLESRIKHRNHKEMNWGRHLSNQSKSFLDSIRSQYIHWRVPRELPLWQMLDQLEFKLHKRIEKTIQLIQSINERRIADSLRAHRTELMNFLKALRARTGGKQEDLFKKIDFKMLLGTFPIWLTNLSDIHDVLPLKKDLFDLALIDEATQCDIASCLPILYRAKRVVITGDPNQLRHLSFLSRERQVNLLEQHRIPLQEADLYDYRALSILDFVNERLSSQDRVVFLNEHYRSEPPIIAFSNERFYGGALHVMTEQPGKYSEKPLTLHRVNGKRIKSGENQEEAQCVLENVLRQVNEEKALNSEACHSIGILSPFRSQVDHIFQQLSRALPLEAFDKHRILIGTAHTFQGEERDIMHLSLVLDENSHFASFRFLDKSDVFNVSITRARVAQTVYISIDPTRLVSESLLRDYLRHIAESSPEFRHDSADDHHDDFIRQVNEELIARGLKSWMAYPIAGMILDLVVARNGRSCGIDLVGYPGASEQVFSLERYQMFHRAGLRIFPLPYTSWFMDREQCLKAIDETLV